MRRRRAGNGPPVLWRRIAGAAFLLRRRGNAFNVSRGLLWGEAVSVFLLPRRAVLAAEFVPVLEQWFCAGAGSLVE